MFLWKEYLDWQHGLRKARLEYHVSRNNLVCVTKPIFLLWRQLAEQRQVSDELSQVPQEVKFRLRIRELTAAFFAWKMYCATHTNKKNTDWHEIPQCVLTSAYSFYMWHSDRYYQPGSKLRQLLVAMQNSRLCRLAQQFLTRLQRARKHSRFA